MDISKLKSTKNTAKHSKKIQQLTDTEEISAVGMLFINWELYTNVFKTGSYLSIEHSPWQHYNLTQFKNQTSGTGNLPKDIQYAVLFYVSIFLKRNITE